MNKQKMPLLSSIEMYIEKLINLKLLIKKYGTYKVSYPANWDKYGRAAGPRRNAEMAAVADALIAFPKAGEKNIGTRNMISLAKEKDLLIRVIGP